MLSLNGKDHQPRPQDKFGLRGLHQVLVDCNSSSENGIVLRVCLSCVLLFVE
jgi:hypothetical protein